MRSASSTFRRFAFFLTLILAQTAFAGSCPNRVTPQQIADALQNSPNLSPSLKSCSMAAMLMKESGGGNTCAQNSCCVGIGQLNVNTSVGGLDLSKYGMTRDQYLHADLQTQINIWADQANMNATSSGYKKLNAAYQSCQSIDGHPVTAGMLAACEQFGAAVCNHNELSLELTGGCGSYTDGNGHTGGQTICSWGATADRQAASQNCSLANQPGQPSCQKGQGGCPSPTNASGGVMASASEASGSAATPLPSTARQPAVASTDVVVSDAQI